MCYNLFFITIKQLMTNSYPISPISEKFGLTIEDMQLNDYVFWKEVNDILYAIVPMTFGKGRLLVDCTRTGYEDFYCFPTIERAVQSLMNFQGLDGEEFQDWHRHFKTGRRRENGDPSTEYINF